MALLAVLIAWQHHLWWLRGGSRQRRFCGGGRQGIGHVTSRVPGVSPPPLLPGETSVTSPAWLSDYS